MYIAVMWNQQEKYNTNHQVMILMEKYIVILYQLYGSYVRSVFHPRSAKRLLICTIPHWSWTQIIAISSAHPGEMVEI